MTITCAQWEELLERYHDGELDTKQSSAVEAHLAQCGACQQSLEALDKIGQWVSLPVEDALRRVSPARMDLLWNRVAARIAEEQPASWSERLARWVEEFWGANRRAILAAGAAAAVTFLIAWPLLRQSPGTTDGNRPSGENPAVLSANEVIVDSLQTGEHDLVLVNVHPEDMTTVIWLLNDTDEPEEGEANTAGAKPAEDNSGTGAPAEGKAAYQPEER